MEYEDFSIVLKERDDGEYSEDESWYMARFKDFHGDDKIIVEHESELSVQKLKNWEYQAEQHEDFELYRLSDRDLAEKLKVGIKRND